MKLKVNESFTNPKKTNPNELVNTVLGWYDFDTNYIDDGGQRRTAEKKNQNTLEWFNEHPLELKQKAYKIMLSKVHSSDKAKVQNTFGKLISEVFATPNTNELKEMKNIKLKSLLGEIKTLNESLNFNKEVKQFLDAELTEEKKPHFPKGAPQFAVMHILIGALRDANFHEQSKQVPSIFPSNIKDIYSDDKEWETNLIDEYEYELGPKVANICKYEGKSIVDAIGFYIGGPVGGKIENLIQIKIDVSDLKQAQKVQLSNGKEYIIDFGTNTAPLSVNDFIYVANVKDYEDCYIGQAGRIVRAITKITGEDKALHKRFVNWWDVEDTIMTPFAKLKL